MTGAEWFSAAPGGLNRYFTDLYRALCGTGEIAVTATAFGDPPPGGRSWGPTGGSTLRRAQRAFADRAGFSRKTILDRHFSLYGPPARGPLVVHFHGPWAGESRIAGETDRAVRAKYLLERLRYARADRFVVLSEHFRDLLVADYRVAADRIAVLPPGVDIDRFPPPEPPPADRAPTVLCVRRLERRMGIDVLLRCWPAVTDRHPHARLIVVGTGTAEPQLRALAGADDSITFTGHIDDDALIRRYAHATCTVVPSLALEGFGLIALESLAAGRPPIVTDCGGLRDSVRGLDPSLIVAPGDPDALAARLAAALDGAAPPPKQCRAHAESFSWARCAHRHLDLYRQLRA
ncbi:glycosyltransferase family 4 protein [Nocardia sp. CDC159]|uniref:Glycosyltransferase family 4 protein n=1 Tax=Nocardia pulmonis TaxID=2951408 RepID=A0A9X2E236_9NOCA|nr:MULTISPECIES: glycosyltransferase family 4 protein [Nocardia]MCM6772175.1 glycosyltransferase family 4 protein [Nocardia pulmonis]MCM6785167.1 glycosyltransferase family 4 protein [Nocardia sp. CDC159]